MSLKRSVRLLVNGLRGKHGYKFFMSALMSTSFIIVIFALLIFAFFKGTADIFSLGASLMLAYYIVGGYQQDEKIDRLKRTIHQEGEQIKRLIKKEKDIDLDKVDEQRKELQDE